MTQLDFLTRRALKSELVTLMEKGNWRQILQFYEERDDYREPLLLWIRPNLEILQYLEFELHSYGLSKILSIGCGCGFLEWLISQATTLKVTGLEVNKSWWTGPHATPHYIPLEFTEPGSIPSLSSDSALLFCYFNNSEYFLQYIKEYSGPMIILIGPLDGLRHCDPEPRFLLSSEFEDWRRVSTKDILTRDERDQIAIYTRKSIL